MSDINSTDIQQALESAIDVGKLGDVFKKLVNAIEDQQAQIKSLTSQLNNDKRTKQLENKIADLDAKFEDLHKNLIGDGSQIEKGNLIEISPYKAFAESIQMVSGKRPSIGGTLANTKSADFANDKRYRESYPSRSSITLKSTKAALLEETTPRRNKSFESVNVLPTISRDFAEDKTEILSETQDTRQVLAKEASFNLAENSEHGPNSDPIATENTAPKHFQDTPYADSAPNVVKATREEDGVTNTNSVADAEDIPREHDADRSEGISDVPGSEAASVGSPKNTDNTAAAVPSELVESALSRIDADASVSPSNKLVDEPTSAKSEKTSAAELGDNGENVELTEEGRKEETIAGGDASLPKVSSVDVTRETNDVDTTRLSNIAPSDTVNQRARDSSGNSSKIQSAINTPRSEARDSKTSSARASPLVTDDASKIDSADGKGETLGSVASNKNTPRSRPPSGGSADGLPVADEAVRASADPRTDKARSASVLKIQSVGRSGSKGGVKFSSDTQDPAAIAAAANRVSKSLGTRQSKSSFSITPEEQNRRSSIALQDNDEDEDEDGDFMPPMKRNNSFSVDLNMFQPITEPGIYDPEENVEVPKFSRVPSKSRELVGDHGEQQVETQQQHVTDPPKGRILKGRPSRISTFSRSNSLQRNARARSMRQISYSTDQENNAPAYKTEDRYRMDARNFPLTDVQRKRICRELQLRGRFFLINKKNLEGSYCTEVFIAISIILWFTDCC